MVRAKVICSAVIKRRHWDGSGRLLYTAEFTPVVSNSEENKKFFEATPSGKIELGTFKEDNFEPNKEYYVDFTPIE